jgi:hypothetical protein
VPETTGETAAIRLGSEAAYVVVDLIVPELDKALVSSPMGDVISPSFGHGGGRGRRQGTSYTPCLIIHRQICFLSSSMTATKFRTVTYKYIVRTFDSTSLCNNSL